MRFMRFLSFSLLFTTSSLMALGQQPPAPPPPEPVPAPVPAPIPMIDFKIVMPRESAKVDGNRFFSWGTYDPLIVKGDIWVYVTDSQGGVIIDRKATKYPGLCQWDYFDDRNLDPCDPVFIQPYWIGLDGKTNGTMNFNKFAIIKK